MLFCQENICSRLGWLSNNYQRQRSEMKERIVQAIDTILKNRGDDWFIIIEEPEKEKFVQFAYDEGIGLFFDLPFQALEADELARARKLLAEYSIGPASSQTYDEPGGKATGVQESFNHHVGRDAALAATLAYRVLSEVYQLDDRTALNVTIMR